MASASFEARLIRSLRLRCCISVVLATLLWGARSSAQTQPEKPATSDPPVESAPAQQPEAPSDPSKPKEKPLPPWQMLTAGVSSHTLVRRQETLAALGTMGPNRRAIRLVEAALSDNDPSIRHLAAQNLGEMHSRRSIPKLKAALDDESPEVSFAAARSLWQMGDRSGRDVFMQILAGNRSSSPGMIKGQVQSAKKQLQDPRALAIIGAKEAASSLFGPAGWGIKIMEEVTKDRSASARAMSAVLLGRDPTPEALQELDDALGEKNWLVRSAAAQALGSSRHREQIPLLEPLLEDQKPAVRYMAAASILRLSSVPAAVAPASSSPSKSSAPAVAPQTSSTHGKDTR